MIYYRCKCGDLESYSSMGPRRCAFCTKCNTTLASGPEGHKTERTKHQMIKEQVETDEGNAVLTRCGYCLRTKKELEGQPMEDLK